MKINRVTITGADDKIKSYDLHDLQLRFPFVEWGILFSGKTGNRYPTMKWLNDLLSDYSDLNLSAHFCGFFSRMVLEQNDFASIDNLNSQFGRVQLNYNFSRGGKFDLGALHTYAKQSDRAIILQYNKSNRYILDEFRDKNLPNNIHFLYDASGGRGVEIQGISTPIDGNYTGYAGGIGDDNVNDICDLITYQLNQSIVWIDLESGARIDDQFNIPICESILSKASKFIKIT